MNLVVLTAAFSSLNAGLYSTGRILRSMSVNGSGPKFTARMSKSGVPYGGILLTAVIGLFGVVLNAVKPSEAFEIVLNIAAVGVLAAWATIVLCQLRFYRHVKSGTLQRPHFRMPLTPYSGYATLAFLVGVLVLMCLDPEKGPWVIAALVAAVPALIGGWFLVRDRVASTAADDVGDQASDVPDLAPD
jgi:L-asparagine permease